jgi:hypothetical protein
MAATEAPEDALRAALGGRAVPGVEALDPAERQALAEAIQDARRRQAEALAAASAGAFDHLPRFARVAVRLIVTGR